MAFKRELKVSMGFNFRDIGGYQNLQGKRVRWHKIVRAAYLSDLSKTDQQLIFNYGIRTIIDLRSDNEVHKYPDKYMSTINYVRIPILNQDLTNSTTAIKNLSENIEYKYGLKHMLEVYRRLVVDRHAQQAYQKIFNIFTQPGLKGGILIHCATGKDRTGLVIILLLKLLGISNQVILRDYLLTNSCSALQINKRLNEAKQAGADSRMLKTVFNLSTVNIKYFNEIVSIVNGRYGGFHKYLFNQLGLTESTVDCLKKRYLY